MGHLIDGSNYLGHFLKKIFHKYSIKIFVKRNIIFFMHCTHILVLEWKVRCSQTVLFFVMLDQNVMFEVRSCCYVTRLVLEHTVWCSRIVQCSKFDFGPKCDVQKVRCSDIQCSECSKFGIMVFVPRLVCLWNDNVIV